MTILSKLVSSRLQALSLVRGPGTRLFRWDAKPDNIQAHSFLKGLYAPSHWTMWIHALGLGTPRCAAWSQRVTDSKRQAP